MKVYSFLLVTLISGCSLYPVVPDLQSNKVLQEAEKNPIQGLTVERARLLTRAMKLALVSSVDSRRRTEITLSELAFYGSLVAVGGNITSSIAARNYGGGTAALAGQFSGRYKSGDQRVAFQSAVDQLACIEEKLEPIVPALRQQEDRNQFELIQAEYDAVPRLTVAALRSVETRLRASLAGISLGTPSTDHLAEVFKRKEKAEGDAKAGADAAAMTQLQKITTRTFSTGELTELGREEINNVELGDAIRRFHMAVATYQEQLATCLPSSD